LLHSAFPSLSSSFIPLSPSYKRLRLLSLLSEKLPPHFALRIQVRS
jgi:hypothetical protein